MSRFIHECVYCRRQFFITQHPLFCPGCGRAHHQPLPKTMDEIMSEAEKGLFDEVFDNEDVGL